jgi:hypothetical protein
MKDIQKIKEFFSKPLEEGTTEYFKPSIRKDKSNPNFLYIDIAYPAGSDVLSVGGSKTMGGQDREEGAAKALSMGNSIAKKLESKYNIEDIEVKDLKNGKVEVFAVSDDFIKMTSPSLDEAKEETAVDMAKKQLDALGVKYELGNKFKPFKTIYKPTGKSDKFYDTFNDIVDLFNLGNAVKSSMSEAKEEDKVDTITMDVPLFLRMLEYSREDAEQDLDLHDVTEKANVLGKERGILSMDDYAEIVGAAEEIQEIEDDKFKNDPWKGGPEYKKEDLLAQKIFGIKYFGWLDSWEQSHLVNKYNLDKNIITKEGKEVNLKQSKLSSAEYQKAKKLKDFKASDWKWNADEDLYTKVNEGELTEEADQKQANNYAYQFMQYFDKMRRIVGGNFGDDTRKEFEKLVQSKFSKHTVNETEELAEAFVPSNIKEFAKRKGVSSLVNKVAGWAEKVGKGIRGGTAIGMNYSTLVLDMTYQGSEIRINTNNDTVTLYDEPVRSFDEFKQVYLDNQDESDNGLEEKINEALNKINEELCPAGKAYIKRRQAAGEKSSAYLSGRGVKVCKGQMSGKAKKKK